MIKTKILSMLGVGLLCVTYAGAPAQAFDAAQSARQSVTESVRDDVRRRIQAREQRFRDSRAEYRDETGTISKRKFRRTQRVE